MFLLMSQSQYIFEFKFFPERQLLLIMRFNSISHLSMARKRCDFLPLFIAESVSAAMQVVEHMRMDYQDSQGSL